MQKDVFEVIVKSDHDQILILQGKDKSIAISPDQVELLCQHLREVAKEFIKPAA